MTTGIKDNLLDDSILVNTFDRVIIFESKKTVFLGDGILAKVLASNLILATPLVRVKYWGPFFKYTCSY